MPTIVICVNNSLPQAYVNTALNLVRDTRPGRGIGLIDLPGWKFATHVSEKFHPGGNIHARFLEASFAAAWCHPPRVVKEDHCFASDFWPRLIRILLLRLLIP